MNATPKYSRLAPAHRREQILDAANVLFAGRSYDEVSVEDIARSAGVARGLVLMKRLAPAGRRVRLRTDPTQDTFDCYDRVNPEVVDIDDLLEPAEVERIEARFLGGLELRANLDRHDVCSSIAAGLLAALVAFSDRAHPRRHPRGPAANAGKIAMYGPAGPFAFNYAQWLAFLKSSIRMFQIKTRSPSRVIVGQAHANAAAFARAGPTSIGPAATRLCFRSQPRDARSKRQRPTQQSG